MAVAARQDGHGPSAGRQRLRPRPRAAGRRDATALGPAVRRRRARARPGPRGRAPTYRRARVTGRPHHGDGRRWCSATLPRRRRAVSRTISTAPIRRRCSSSCGRFPTTSTAAMVVGHNPTAQSLAQGLVSPRDKKGMALAVRQGFPTCALGVYRFTRAENWAEVDAALGQAGRLARPALLTRAARSGGVSAEAAQDGGVALPAAAAERDGRRRGTAAAELEERGQRDPGTRHADRVAQRDGAPVDVDLVLVDPEVVDRGEPDGGEGLVDLEQVDRRRDRSRPCLRP